MLRAVVDTNVWVSALLNPAGAPARILEAFVNRTFVAVTSASMLDELRDVLSRPRIATRYSISEPERSEYIDLLRIGSFVVPVEGTIQLCRDPDDDVVIETALRGNADFLVSRDDDLKGSSDVIRFLAEASITVLSVHRFLEEVARSELS